MKRAWLAPLGALIALALAAAAAIGFLRWRTSEQQRALRVHRERCERGQREDCDWLRTACSKRAGTACLHLARCYLTGTGVTRSHSEATHLGETGCRFQSAEACLLSAELLEQGQHVPRDTAKAKDLYERACRLGDRRGCERVPRMSP